MARWDGGEGYSRKNLNRRGFRTYFFEKISGIFRFVTLALEIRDKSKIHPWKFYRIVLYFLKIPKWKPRPTEIPHDFFLTTCGNSASFLIDLWNLHILFFLYPWKFHLLNHPCLDFFWNSQIDKTLLRLQKLCSCAGNHGFFRKAICPKF